MTRLAEGAAVDDARIRELIVKGDFRAAATDAIRGLGRPILRYLRSLLRDETEAAEAFSQFAESLWTGLPGFRGEASLRTWAYRVAWSAARDLRDQAWRRRGRRLETSEATAIAEEVRSSSVDRIEQERRALDELRSSLSLEEQSLLILRVDQELSWAEIADVLAEKGSAVQPMALAKRYERLKQRLQALAKEQGLIE